jgi:hypothetical protein
LGSAFANAVTAEKRRARRRINFISTSFEEIVSEWQEGESENVKREWGV